MPTHVGFAVVLVAGGCAVALGHRTHSIPDASALRGA
ncbi:hypothetical protein J2754_001763 [Halarchaeum solikamskense]|nr:hypothetical protein [Halarchaeum solikamskense]